MLRRTGIKRVSAKRAKQNGGRKLYSTLTSSGRVKPVNAKRKASEFARCYHSVERVEFIKTLRCVGCRSIGAVQRTGSVNAHIAGDGAGRKADYTKLVPLCDDCHHKQHTWGAGTFAIRYRLDLRALAAEAEAKWQAHLNGE